jgi:long-chain acyl-CoA synthetase
MAEERSFLSQLVTACETRGDARAMSIVGSDDASYTFAQFLRAIRSVAWRLRSEGVEFGDRVAVIGENHPSWAIAYLGILYHGAVAVPLDPHGEVETLTNFLENSQARLAFLSPDQIEQFSKINEKLTTTIKGIVWKVGDGQEALPAGFEPFEDWLATDFPAEFAAEMPRAAGRDMAVLMYTSGTTGTPKGVPLTHGNIAGELAGVNKVLRITHDDKILSLLPLFHAYLQVVNLWVASTFGAEAGYLKELTPAELSESMKKFQPTMMATVPRLWYLFHKKIFDAVEAKPRPVQMIFRTLLKLNGFTRDTFNINLGPKLFGEVHKGFGGNLNRAISAGSRFDDAVAKDFHRLGFTIIQGYGLTETSGAATATYEGDNRVGSVGKPMGDAEIKIHEPNAEGVGEVLIRGAMVFDGYYQNPEATRDAFIDGWFRSGDLGRIDKDGFLYIVGRAKDVIVLPSGKNVHPEDLETHYLKSPLVEELAIIGVEDPAERAGSEKLAAVVVPDLAYMKSNGIANSKEAIRHDLDSLGRALPEYQRVRDYMIRLEPLPRTATNKIKRFQLQSEVAQGLISSNGTEPRKVWTLTDEDRAFLLSKNAEAVVAAIRQNAKDAPEIHPDMNLEIDLGLDSLGRAETFAALEHAFQTEFEAEDAAGALTVRNAVELVDAKVGKDADITTVDLNWGDIVRASNESALPDVEHILHDRPIFSAFAFSVYKLFNLIFRVFLQLEVKGLENLTGTRASTGAQASRLQTATETVAPQSPHSFLICPNHQSFLDPFVLCSTYNYDLFSRTFHVGASEFFEGPVTRFIAKMLNIVPVNPDTELMRAMKAGAIGLKNGRILNIYPEGERAFDGELHGFKKGAAILASELDLPIVPVAIDGLYKVWPRASSRIRLHKVKLTIGEPFCARDILGHAGPYDDADYERVTAHLKSTIAQMIEIMRRSEPPA